MVLRKPLAYNGGMKSLLLFLLLPVLAFAGVPLCKSRAYSPAEVRELLPSSLRDAAPHLASAAYAEVDASQLALFHGQFWAWLFKQGIPTTAMRRGAGWPRFDCVDYSTGYIFRARLRHQADDWRAPERTHPAMFRVAYRPTVDRFAPPPLAPNHCIVWMLTTEGPVFIDPQVGRVVLSESEISSLYWPVE